MHSQPPFLLPELECDTPGLQQWAPLRSLAQDAVGGGLAPQEPQSEIVDMAVELVRENKKDADLLNRFWEKRGGGSFPFERYCVFGHFTALYVIAWNAASEGQHHVSAKYLRQANTLLRIDDHDLLDHTSWPFSSWDLLSNLQASIQGKPFRLQWSRIVPSQEIGQRLPLVWPQLSSGFFIPRIGSHGKALPRRRVTVWWTSKHPGPFADIVTIMERFMTDRYEVHMHSNAVSEYCQFPLYKDWLCTRDSVFAEDILRRSFLLSHKSQAECGVVRGQWCGLRELHGEFNLTVAAFEQHFKRNIALDVDLFICGHPLYWCRLFENFDTSVIGIWEMSHHFAVPEQLQEMWHAQFINMFTKATNLLVGFGAFHSFQAQWLLGINVPYYPPIALDVALRARYNPIYNDSVLLSVFITPYEVEMIQRLARTLTDYPFKLLAWPKDIACGGDCPKAELARFRAVVLCAYDTSTLKLAEFYAMHVPIFIHTSGLWRTAMRWAKASAGDAGPNATFMGKVPDVSWAADSWAKAIEYELSHAHWEEPFRLSNTYGQVFPSMSENAPHVDCSGSLANIEKRSESIEDAIDFKQADVDTAVGHFLLEGHCFRQRGRMPALEFWVELTNTTSSLASDSDVELFCIQLYRPVDKSSNQYEVVNEDCTPRVVPRHHDASIGFGIAFATSIVDVEVGNYTKIHGKS